jgi:hypothetical protein
MFQHFEIKAAQLSPLQLAKMDQKKRQRARRTKEIEKPTLDW